jgi:putative ABC transport system permease protein
VSALRSGRRRHLQTAAALWASRVTLHRNARPSGALVVFEIAATMVLLTGAGLLINSYSRLMRVESGMDPDRVITLQLALGGTRYTSPTAQQHMVHDVLVRVRALPGVDAAGATSLSLDGEPFAVSPLSVDARVVTNAIRYRYVTSDYFRALGIRLRNGREFVDSTDGAASEAAIVNEAFVRRYLDGRNAVGSTLSQFDGRTKQDVTRQIVGVVADAKLRLHEDAEPILYLRSDRRADSRAFFGLTTFVVRGGGPQQLVPGIRAIVSQLDPQLAVHNVATIDAMIGHTAASPKFYGFVSLWCGVIALLLAGTGLYGVVAYSVGTQTREMGIRIALGATAGMLTTSVLRQGLTLAVAGIAVGLAGAYYLTQFLQALLFGLTPNDPTTFATAALMFVAVALVASYVPSRRATRVDPVAALRAE